MEEYRRREQARKENSPVKPSAPTAGRVPSAGDIVKPREPVQVVVAGPRGPPPAAHASALPPASPPAPKVPRVAQAPKAPAELGGGRLGGNTKESYRMSSDKDALRDTRAAFFEAKMKEKAQERLLRQ